MTNVCSTVILLLLMVKKTMSNQLPSACSVNNLDRSGRPGGGFAYEKNLGRNTCSLNGALYLSLNYFTDSL